MVIFQGVMVVNAKFDKKKTTMILFRKEKWTGGQNVEQSQSVQNSGELLKETFTTAWVYLVWWTDVQLWKGKTWQLFVMERTLNLQKRLGVNSDLSHNQTKDFDVVWNVTFIFSSDNFNNIYTYAWKIVQSW